MIILKNVRIKNASESSNSLKIAVCSFFAFILILQQQHLPEVIFMLWDGFINEGLPNSIDVLERNC